MAADGELRSGSRRHAVAPRFRPGYPVAAAMLVATVSFAVSLWYSHSLLLPLDARTLTITEDALPSVEHLAQARVELVRIRMQLERASSGSAGDRSTATQRLLAARQALMAELLRYRQLPTSAEEMRLLQDLDADLMPLEGTAAATLATASARPEVLDAALARAASQLERLERLNADEALSSAGKILLLRRHTAQVATLLGVVSLAIAVMALLLTLGVLRGQGRLLQAHTSLLSQRSEELEAFSGRVAHDLRDPLTAMALGIRAAGTDASRDTGTTQLLERIGRQISRMEDIINGLLEFASAGANPTPGARADLAQVLDEAVSTLLPKAVAAQAQLQIEPFDHVQLACTPAALGSVVANLIGNAVKYIVESPHPQRLIGIQVRAYGTMARVEVADNGPGLPPGAEQHIFEPFRRLAGTRQPGVGLGLATVRKIVEAYRGRVGVNARPGDGSTFWFELPIAPDDPATP